VIGGGAATPHVELDFARQLDDGLGMMPVLEQRVFDGLGAVDEQTAIETILFLRDPLAAAVFADEDDVGQKTARGRFDELHVGYPSGIEQRVFPKATDRSVAVSLAWECSDGSLAGDGFAHAHNIFPA
jgi:hypothetical protein